MIFEPFQFISDVVTVIYPVKRLGNQVEFRPFQRIQEIIFGQFVTATVCNILNLIGNLSADTFDFLGCDIYLHASG